MALRTVLVPALAVALAAGCSRSPGANLKAKPVTKGPITEVVSATGEVTALVTVSVGSQVSGTISRILVDFNSVVKKGDLLARIDARLFQAARERAVAGLAAALADAERARVTLADAERVERRTQTLLRRALVSNADAETAVAGRESAAAALRGARARVLQARADRDTAITNVALCDIVSPIDGVVISRNVDVGQTVASSLQAPTLFMIANDLDRMQILANVDEADVGKVKEGMKARFTVDAFPGEVFKGTIRQVRQAPSTIQNVVTYAAVIDAPNGDRKLRHGMTTAVSIVANKRAEALRVPNAALRYRPPGEPDEGDRPERSKVARLVGGRAEAADPPARAPGQEDAPPEPPVRKATVYRAEGKKAVPVTVMLGISDGHQTEVAAGLSEGDLVVVGDAGTGAAKPKGAKHGLD